jgi:hypothetical protein
MFVPFGKLECFGSGLLALLTAPGIKRRGRPSLSQPVGFHQSSGLWVIYVHRE